MSTGGPLVFVAEAPVYFARVMLHADRSVWLVQQQAVRRGLDRLIALGNGHRLAAER